MKRAFFFISTALGLCVLALVPSTAQEKSVRPGINTGYENPDPKVFVEKFGDFYIPCG